MHVIPILMSRLNALKPEYHVATERVKVRLVVFVIN